MRTTKRANARRSITRSVMLLAVLTFAGTGCQAADQGEPEEASVTVDLETVRNQFRTDLREAEQMLQPAQFESKDAVDEVSGPCDLPDGSEGSAYLFKTRQAVGHVGDPEAKANLIADHWRGKGYKVEMATELGYRVTARTHKGGALSFIVGEPGMTLSGETPCVPA